MTPRRVVERYLAGDEELLADETLRQREDAFRSAFPDAKVTAEVVSPKATLSPHT